MNSLANLEERIRELLINHYWDVNIYDHPDIMEEAKRLGMDERQLNQKVIAIDSAIDKRPYAIIDEVMEEPISKGAVHDRDIKAALTKLEGKIPEHKVVQYIIHKIKRHHFEPRDRVPLDFNSFRNPWMTNDAWKKYQETNLEVEWLGEKARTPEEMGEISFRKKEDAQYYTRNNHYLPTLVTILTKNPAKADGFARIIEAEQDPELRYLKIIYRLNPSLPFRFRGEMFRTPVDLVNAAMLSPEAFWGLAQMYSNRYIHAWLEETNAEARVHLTTERDTNGFLSFIYRVNTAYPFYLKQKRVDTPEALVTEARANAGIWPDIATALENGTLAAWFTGIGHQDWNTRLEAAMSPIVASPLYSFDDRRLASVQTLIGIVAADTRVPCVETSPAAISALNIEAGKPVKLPLLVKMASEGFLKMSVAMDQQIQGISINRNTIGFYSQDGKAEELIHIGVDAMQLLKDKKYQFNILLQSVYGTTRVPVALRVVFPKKAFLIHLAKYAAFGALFFGLIAFLVQSMAISLPLDTNSPYLDFDWDGWNLPLTYLAYILPVVLLLAGFIFSIFLIRKIEKI